MTLFHSAATQCHERHTDQGALALNEWISAILKGADEYSPAARHLLAFGGLIVALASRDHDFMSTSSGLMLETSFIQAANATLTQTDPSDEYSHASVCLAINHAFAYLSDTERSKLDYDRLLPTLMASAFHSPHGLNSAYFVAAADGDFQQVSHQKFNWAADSPSYLRVDAILKSPLISSLGPLSRLIAHTLDQVQDSWLVLSAVEDIADFTHRLGMQWRQTKLSEIDVSEEAIFLHDEAQKTTVPTLWRLLRSVLFAIVIILRSAVGRVVQDFSLATRGSKLCSAPAKPIAYTNQAAPKIAKETLQCLRNLSFVFSRLGNVSFSQYTFTYLTSIDILANYPTHSSEFLTSIAPSELGQIPSHPLERDLDLYFLNTAEHFALVLSPRENEDLLLAAASPYLIAAGNPNLLPIFEAAHSVTLSVFSAPQNVEVTAKHLPFYVDALFRVFPQNLSARQFRLAFKNLIKVVSPPSRIAIAQPLMAATLLDIVHERAIHAPTAPMPPTYVPMVPIAPELESASPPAVPDLSEQAVLILTLVDALPWLSLALLEEWLPMCGAAIQMNSDRLMQEHCKKHFWETLVGGEMDPERSQICVRWWTTRGGRESLLYMDEPTNDGFVMSGGLGEQEKVIAKL